MDEKNLIIVCITAIICVAIVSMAAVMMTNNNQVETNNTTNDTINVTLNESNNTTSETTQTTTKKSTAKSKSKEREEDKVTADGWNPKEHEVSREKLDDGMERVNYDDGYFRVVDKQGNILSYGY